MGNTSKTISIGHSTHVQSPTQPFVVDSVGSLADTAHVSPSLNASDILSALPTVHVNHHPMQTRSKSSIVKKKVFLAIELPLAIVDEPTSSTQASKVHEWQCAMGEEFQALLTQHSWSLVPLPPNKHAIGCKWVYKIKRHPDGSVTRYKTRLLLKVFIKKRVWIIMKHLAL